MPRLGSRGEPDDRGRSVRGVLTSIVRRACRPGGRRWLLAALAALVGAVGIAFVSTLATQASPGPVVPFEDRELDGVGNLRTLEGLSKRQIAGLLPAELYCLYVGDLDVPPGWPSHTQVKQYEETTDVNGNELLLEIWQTKTAEGSWENFKATDLTSHEEAGVELTYIYESRGGCYTPVVRLLFSSEDKCTQASLSVCEQILAWRASQRASR